MFTPLSPTDFLAPKFPPPRARERHGHSFIHLSHPIPSRYIAGSDLQAPSHSVALAKKRQASKRVHELHPTCNYMYMYMYLLRYPYLGTCTVQPWNYLQYMQDLYMNCHHQYNWKSLTCLLPRDFLRWALFVSPLNLLYSLSLARSLALSG